MKRVCILTSVHPPFDVRIFHKQCKSLVKAGYDVTLIAPHDREEVVDGIRIMPVPRTSRRLVRMTWTVAKLYRQAVRTNAEVYHFHDPELIPVGLMLKLKRKKVIYDVHEYYQVKILSKRYIPGFLRKLVAWVFDVWEPFASRFFDAIVVVERPMARKFAGKVVPVQNYPRRLEGIEPVRERGDCFRIVYVGRLSEERGLFKMIEAMDHIHAPAKLLLVGGFESDSVRRRAEATTGYDRVEWLPSRPWPEAMKILSSCHLGLAVFQPVPACLFAGEGANKLFEYMMFGLPVVASRFENLREIIEKEDCGLLVDPTDSRAIANAISELRQTPELSRRMGINGAKAVKERYNWEHASERLLGLYASICGN